MNRKAFTLVELLVVISIIALLLSIMMPSLQKARELARKVVCKNQMRQITLGSVAYASSNKDKFPQSIGAANPEPSQWPGDSSDLSGMTTQEQWAHVAKYATWWGLIGDYVGLDKGKMDSVEKLREVSARSLGHCPNHGFMGGTEGDRLSFSYCGNANIFRNWNEYVPRVGLSRVPAIKTIAVKSPHAKVLVYEMFMNADWPLAYTQSIWRGKPNKEFFGVKGTQHSFDPGRDGSGWGATHGRDLNYGFADGHTESISHLILMGDPYFLPSTSVSR